MFKNLTYDRKNKMLVIGSVLFLLLAWFLAFGKTADAIRLNRELKHKEAGSNDLSYNPASTAGKLTALNVALNRFGVDSVEWKDEFWLKVSRTAAQKNVDIIYEPSDTDIRDSTTTVLQQAISFSGKYKDLVLLLDSIERLDGIGRIRSVELSKLSKPGAESNPGRLSMALQFYALNKQDENFNK